MEQKKYEDAIKLCYSTWGSSYYEEYYGENAAYPPVHRELIRRELLERGVKTLLDAGCGPASFLRDIAEDGMELYGFDLTPEMITECRRVMCKRGFPAQNFWEGSVTNPADYKKGLRSYDAAVCVGVLPHIPAPADEVVFGNLRSAVRTGGTVMVEARNQLFALFTMNRYSHDLIVNEMVRPADAVNSFVSGTESLDGIIEEMKKFYRMDLPPVRKGKGKEPGYDEVLSRTHNPIVVKDRFAAAGFANVKVLFYHYHALPPMFQKSAPEFFRAQSLAMENPNDWRGYFMASAFILAGTAA
jgi:2-polyprenyl-3-methyl-5-hydroxy-6-metoxy-1,4-benzoquinol methylase